MESGEGRFRGRVVAGVLAVVQNHRRQVLFVQQQRGPYAGHWLLPGGGIEPGEPASAAVVREVREEAGITLQDPEFQACYELRGTWSEGPYHLLMLAFSATTYQEVPPGFQGAGVGGAAFFAVRQVQLHPTDMQILTDANLATISRSTILRELHGAGIELARYGLKPWEPPSEGEAVARRLRP